MPCTRWLDPVNSCTSQARGTAELRHVYLSHPTHQLHPQRPRRSVSSPSPQASFLTPNDLMKERINVAAFSHGGVNPDNERCCHYFIPYFLMKRADPKILEYTARRTSSAYNTRDLEEMFSNNPLTPSRYTPRLGKRCGTEITHSSPTISSTATERRSNGLSRLHPPTPHGHWKPETCTFLAESQKEPRSMYHATLSKIKEHL